MGTYFAKRLKSFSYAINGLKILIREPNFKIHLFATVLVVGLSAYLDVSQFDWSILLFLIGVTLALEAVNTAIELLSDRVTKEHDPMIKKVKDVSAAAVLLMTIFDVIIGSLIFYPYLIQLI